MPVNLPIHFAQNINVAALPNARIKINAIWFALINETKAAHFEINIPNGAINMAIMPTSINLARRGMRTNKASMSSIFLLPM